MGDEAPSEIFSCRPVRWAPELRRLKMIEQEEKATFAEDVTLDLEAILAEADVDAAELDDERIATAMRAIAW